MISSGKRIKLVMLISAHKNGEQLRRLILALQHPQIKVYVHLDRKSTIDPRVIPSEACRVKNNVEVTWGAYSQVNATLNSLMEIVENEPDTDYVSLISGQDYPVRSPEQLLDFLAQHDGTEFIAHVPLDHSGWKKAMVRFERYYFHSYESKVITAAGEYFAGLMDLLKWKRRFYRGLHPFGGSAWWTLSGDCIRYVLDYTMRQKGFQRFMKMTSHPDEMFFHTVVMNSPFARLAANELLHYLEWIKGNQNPNILTRADYKRIIASGKFFARKFDPGVDPCILDMLDQYRKASVS